MSQKVILVVKTVLTQNKELCLSSYIITSKILEAQYIPEFGGFYKKVWKVVEECSETNGICPTCVIEKVWE